MTYLEFEKWVASRKFDGRGDIASALRVTAQTLRNWERNRHVPYWVLLATISVDCGECPYNNLSISNFKRWQHAHGLTTNELTGEVLGRERQSVHQWFSRQSFPKWLPLACHGYDVLKNKPVLN